MKKVLITGADGFVGTQLSYLLAGNGYQVRAQVMEKKSETFLKEAAKKGITVVVSGDLTSAPNLTPLVTEVDVVVHLAAKVHQVGGTGLEHISSYRKVNAELTGKLAKTALLEGVKQFIFLSTIKVHGEMTAGEKALQETDGFKPQDAYAQSKREAEEILQAVAQQAAMHVTVIRPPLVYGPGVKANFLRLMKLVDRGMPLPFGKCNNLRSMIFVGNLVDVIKRCLEVPLAAFQPFLVSDGEDVSTARLVKVIAQSFGKKAKLIPIPESLLEGGASLVGYKEEITKLTGSLQVNIQKVKDQLKWSPRYTIEEGVRETVAWYNHSKE